MAYVAYPLSYTPVKKLDPASFIKRVSNKAEILLADTRTLKDFKKDDKKAASKARMANRILSRIGRGTYALVDNPGRELKLGDNMFYCREEALLTSVENLEDFIIPQAMESASKAILELARLEELLKQYKSELGPDGADCEKAAKPKVIVTLR